jgi:hypothetical protein
MRNSPPLKPSLKIHGNALLQGEALPVYPGHRPVDSQNQLQSPSSPPLRLHMVPMIPDRIIISAYRGYGQNHICWEDLRGNWALTA